jgi:hypothetical protein
MTTNKHEDGKIVYSHPIKHIQHRFDSLSPRNRTMAVFQGSAYLPMPKDPAALN